MAFRRAGFFTLVAGTTALGAGFMFRIVAAGGFTLLEAGILGLFAVTFGWIVVPFWTAAAGFLLQVLGRDALSLRRIRDEPALPVGGLTSRTALVMPVYGENPEQVEARLSAMARSLEETGHADGFDIHLLSDTRDGACARREEAAWARLQGTHPEIAFFYRRRPENRGRKAGNIAEFCRRCVDDYAFMVVLDADSLMSGSTLVRLAVRMEADSTLGLIQTVPLPVRQETAFGRLIQFAGCLYGPLLATGQSFWQGDTANYWGHNAIVRLRPFAEHAVLPVLPGEPPLGGEILSHDFVEAAWLRRAGWAVVLDASATGSFEEVPATVPDYVARDRRWAQGSLQHLRLLLEPGLAFTSRTHFALGAMGYLSSLLWLAFLLAGTAYVLIPGAGGWALDLPVSPLPGRVPLLAATAVVLFLPKVLGIALALVDARRRGGSRVALLASATLETLFSVLLAPIMMLAHTRFVLAICAGRSVGWEPQPRDGDTLSWSAAFRAAAPATALGVVWGGSTLALSPGFFVWMSPIFVGLLLAAPLIRWSSSARVGAFARRAGLLVTPFEEAPPAELRSVLEAIAPGRATDPPRHTGVPPIMHNAERGLFDLRRGRPLLVREDRDGAGAGTTQVLVAGVEGLGPSDLAQLRRLAASEPRLVVTRHRAAAMGFEGDRHARAYSLALGDGIEAREIVRLAAEPMASPRADLGGAPSPLRPAGASEGAGLALAHLGSMLPAVLAFPVSPEPSAALAAALDSGAVLGVDASEALAFVDVAGAEVRRVSEAPVPLSQAEHTRFILFRETYGLGEHVAILVGAPDQWPDPVPVRLHSACLTGDLFGSLRCDCGEQLRGSLDVFEAMGGGVLLYLAQEGRGIGLGNKFRAYTLQEGGLDTIDADSTLGFGADERRYDIAARILHEVGVERIELLTNNPDKVQAMEDAGITVTRRRPLHGRLNRHNLPYVRAKVQRAGHWLGDMLSQPITGD